MLVYALPMAVRYEIQIMLRTLIYVYQKIEYIMDILLEVKLLVLLKEPRFHISYHQGSKHMKF